MHISDGILSIPVYAGGAAIAVAITAHSLKNTRSEDIPRISVMTAAFFVASLIHIRIGPSSGHLLLNGLIGIILGMSAFPAILVALIFQAIMFQHGGITTLGVNSLAMGLPALMAYLIFKLRKLIKSEKSIVISLLSYLSGFLSVILSAVLISLFLAAAGKELFNTAKVVLIVHAPIAIVEGFITAFVVSFLLKIKPEMVSQ